MGWTSIRDKERPSGNGQYNLKNYFDRLGRRITKSTSTSKDKCPLVQSTRQIYLKFLKFEKIPRRTSPYSFNFVEQLFNYYFSLCPFDVAVLTQKAHTKTNFLFQFQ